MAILRKFTIKHLHFLPFVKKNESSHFFVFLSTKALSNLLTSLRYFPSFKINQFTSLANLIFGNNYVCFASLDSHLILTYFASLRYLKVHKHELFILFCRNRNLKVPRASNMRFGQDIWLYREYTYVNYDFYKYCGEKPVLERLRSTVCPALYSWCGEGVGTPVIGCPQILWKLNHNIKIL